MPIRYSWSCLCVIPQMRNFSWFASHLQSKCGFPGLVFFTIRWWDPVFFEAMHFDEDAHKGSWPYAETKSYLWTWLFFVPLAASLFSHCKCALRTETAARSRSDDLLQGELSKKAQKANNLWWRLSGLLGDQNRLFMFILLQVVFTVATTALTVPIFPSYELHVTFQLLTVSATIWNGGNFLLEMMPRQVILKQKRKTEMGPVVVETSVKLTDGSEVTLSQ
ncbi:glycerophosphocholine acyltransferase 1-like isoform X1 [Salvia splendens]|uniref:glycerophosphocholine acyltransferase 1-like isoform X1 n=1 Tax=Salvia splendens TaxID=180675 RepID=UPI001C261BC2|nr:glycerophosphocholine acyltransferase 1-like isoform X1 [Salvia splendens]